LPALQWPSQHLRAPQAFPAGNHSVAARMAQAHYADLSQLHRAFQTPGWMPCPHLQQGVCPLSGMPSVVSVIALSRRWSSLCGARLRSLLPMRSCTIRCETKCILGALSGDTSVIQGAYLQESKPGVCSFELTGVAPGRAWTIALWRGRDMSCSLFMKLLVDLQLVMNKG